MDKDESLQLKNQLCFPLYAAAKETVRKYKPHLDKLGLTYTQYIVMLVLWEEKEVNVTILGDRLFLDSGTLTPVLKTLETKGLIYRHRSKDDERVLVVTLTDKGLALKEQAYSVPSEMSKCVLLNQDESITLYRLLYKLLGR